LLEAKNVSAWLNQTASSSTISMHADGLTDSMYASLKAMVEESLEMRAKEDYEKQKKKR